MLMYNIRQFGYSRAHHYHFFLDEFDRFDDGHPSYANDADNSLELTFSQEDKKYKGDRLDELINRKLFTLPGKES